MNLNREENSESSLFEQVTSMGYSIVNTLAGSVMPDQSARENLSNSSQYQSDNIDQSGSDDNSVEDNAIFSEPMNTLLPAEHSIEGGVSNDANLESTYARVDLAGRVITRRPN